MQVESFEATVRVTVPRETLGDASLSLLSVPSLRIRVVAPGTLAHLPEIQALLEERVTAIIKRLLIAPASQKIPLELTAFMARPDTLLSRSPLTMPTLTSSTGLNVRVVSASGLVAMDSNGFSDPYCVLHIDNGPSYRTKTKKRTLNPKWDDEFYL